VILFWLICAVLVTIALSFILPPLLQRSDAVHQDDNERREANVEIYRDQLSELKTDLDNGIVSQEQYDQDRDEIERRLLEDVELSDSDAKATIPTGKKSLVYAVALGLPLIAVVFYLRVGELKGLSPSEVRPAMSSVASSGGRSQQQIDANVAALVERLKTNPSDSQGWVMLARSYNSMGRFGESAGAYARATELLPNDADLLAEYAFVSAMANGRQLEGQPMDLVNRALKVDPENLKALQLAGNGAFQRKDYKQAIDYWSRVLKKVPAESEVAVSIQQRIDEAKSLDTKK